MSEELFIGLEESNLEEFISRCCEAPLSLEPLCRVCCGVCGRGLKSWLDFKSVVHENEKKESGDE